MLYVENILLNLARKEIQQRKNKLQFTGERVIVSVRAQVMFQLIKWTRDLKHLPVIAKPPSLLRVCSWALQGKGAAGTKVLTNFWSSVPPDSPSLHRWSYLEPVDLEHLLWTIPLLHTFPVRSAATPKPSSLSFPLWFITFFFLNWDSAIHLQC